MHIISVFLVCQYVFISFSGFLLTVPFFCSNISI
nr:MAG TPA: hypothetical protein [Caudoviricetes sp.]